MALIARVIASNRKTVSHPVDGASLKVIAPKGVRIEIVDTLTGKPLPLAGFRKPHGRKDASEITFRHGDRDVTVQVEEADLAAAGSQPHAGAARTRPRPRPRPGSTSPRLTIRARRTATTSPAPPPD